MAKVRLVGQSDVYDLYSDPLTRQAWYFHKPTNKWVQVQGSTTVEVPAPTVLTANDPDPAPEVPDRSGPRAQSSTNPFMNGLNAVDLSGNESDFDAMAAALLSNFEKNQGAQIASPVRRRYKELADRMSTLFDLEKAGGAQFDTGQTLADFFQSLNSGRGNAYSASWAGGGKKALQGALKAYDAGGYQGNTTAAALFGDSDDAQRRQYEALVDGLSTDVAPHLRAALRETLADLYGRYRAQPATGTGNLFTFARSLGYL